MTYEEADVVTLLKIAIEDPKDDYVILKEPEGLGGGNGRGGGGCCSLPSSSSSSRSCSSVGGGFWCSLWWWSKLVLVFIFLAVVGVCFFLWIGPFLMNKEVIPILNWETETFSKPVLAVLIFTSVAIFPTILLPSTPSMWVAGMSFGYGFGFLLIISGVIIGTSLPYFIGSLFYHKIQGWLERYPKKASILKLAGMVPEIFVAIYTGIMIRTLADASNDQHSLSVTQILGTVGGFLLTITTTVLVTVYAKRRLNELQKDEEQLLLQ
ncbi:unnamed protein product [Lactuca virosa]|uniref:SNARE associated Golgi protein n=1 Tax=Lactuca virosa TaxID=75947 RepID=A0AAU9PN28_9ASTR|nr:unnamed protein product [Lactuca virosa]